MLVSVEDLAGYLHIEDLTDEVTTQRLENASGLAQALAESIVGYRLEDDFNTTYIVDGSGTSQIFVPQMYVTNLKRVAFKFLDTWDDQDLTSFVLYPHGELFFIGGAFPVGRQNVMVVCDIELSSSAKLTARAAICEIASVIFNSPGLTSYKSVNEGFSRDQFDAGLLNPTVLAALKSLRCFNA